VWNTRGVEGVHRFLARVWRAFEGGVSDDEPTRDQLRVLHATIKKVGGGGTRGAGRPALAAGARFRAAARGRPLARLRRGREQTPRL
jgi:hypothetical protein